MEVLFNDLQGVNASFGTCLKEAVERVIFSGWYVHGENCAMFEREFADYVGASKCVGTANGLDALTLALISMKLLYGWEDTAEVIVPSNSFIATALAVTQARLRPVFCDCQSSDALIDVGSAEQCITENTRAIIPVHLYGRLCDMKSVNDLAHKYGLKVLEDACQAHGAVSLTENGKGAGSLGDAAAFSFYPGKNLGALGDGGCVTTNDEELSDVVRSLGNYGQESKYKHTFKGRNSRLDELQAAVLRLKLKRLDEDNSRRRQLARMYVENIHSSLVSVVEASGAAQSDVHHIFPVRCSRRDELQRYLSGNGIQSLIHYPCPIHRQEAYKEFRSLSFPNAERWAETELSLPMSAVLTEDQVMYVAEVINCFK